MLKATTIPSPIQIRISESNYKDTLVFPDKDCLEEFIILADAYAGFNCQTGRKAHAIRRLREITAEFDLCKSHLGLRTAKLLIENGWPALDYDEEEF